MALIQKAGVVPAVRIKQSRAHVAIVPQATAPMAMQLQLTAAAVKGANQLVITDIPLGAIAAKNYLLFKDPATDMVYFPVQLRTAYSGGVNLQVEPIAEAIPDTAEAIFMSEMCYRTEQSNQSRQNSQTFETICHTVAEQIPGSPSYSGNFPGGFSYYDAGVMTMEYAALHQLMVCVEKRYPKPEATGWLSGKIERGYGIPTFSGGEINGVEAQNFTIDYQSYEVISAKPTTV
jgi:hypothetical protein